MGVGAMEPAADFVSMPSLSSKGPLLFLEEPSSLSRRKGHLIQAWPSRVKDMPL